MIRNLLIILAIYYGYKFITKYFSNSNVGGQKSNFRHSSETKVKEGTTTIDKKPQQQQSSNKDVGEYVDFEEVE